MDNTVKKDDKRNTSNGIRFKDYERKHISSCSSNKSASEDGFRDREIEEFLHSRGAVGSRMDERGPYFPNSKGKNLVSHNEMGYREIWDNRAILGPKKPLVSSQTRLQMKSHMKKGRKGPNE